MIAHNVCCKSFIENILSTSHFHSAPLFSSFEATNSCAVSLWVSLIFQVLVILCYNKFPSFFQVSWLRHQNVEIMAVGGQIFTSDPRFTSTASEDEGRYTLVISRVRPQDEGTYECQITTKPTKSLFIHLFITSMFLFLTLISRKKYTNGAWELVGWGTPQLDG